MIIDLRVPLRSLCPCGKGLSLLRFRPFAFSTRGFDLIRQIPPARYVQMRWGGSLTG
jgi:hypothetical protein